MRHLLLCLVSDETVARFEGCRHRAEHRLSFRFASGLGFALAMSVSLLAAQPASATDKGPTVFAAASLKNALDAVAKDWRQETGNEAVSCRQSLATASSAFFR